MATYKVPQDVEAEDKLIGPFSFRQFIYLGVAALGIGAGIGLFQLFPGLVIVPLPIVLLFLALALPLRKDQPMETYLVAVVRFFLKPRRRLWQPEGSIDLVTIVASKTAEVQLTKSVGGTAAAAQLGYLAQVVDTQGWASRGVVNPTASMNDIAFAEAQQAEDMLDEQANVSRTFDSMIDKSSDTYRQSVVQQFQAAAHAPQPPTPPTVTAAPLTTIPEPPQPDVPSIGNQPQLLDEPLNDSPIDAASPHFTYNPYPNSMHQHMLHPLSDTYEPEETPAQDQPASIPQQIQPVPSTFSAPTPSPEPISPDIMRLASNNDLSISAIANEAHRIQQRDDEEVVINLH